MVRRKNKSDSFDNDDERPTRHKQFKRTDDNDERPIRRKQSKRTDHDEEEPSTTTPSGTLQVRNKMVRQLLYAKLKRSKSKTKLKERKARKQSDEPREEPKTIEKKTFT